LQKKLALTSLMIFATAFLVGIGLHGYERRRQQLLARAHVGQHLSLLMASIYAYAQAHEGRYPSDLQQLVADKNLDAGRASDLELVVIYLGAGASRASVTPYDVIALERPELATENLSALLADGSIVLVAKAGIPPSAEMKASKLKATRNSDGTYSVSSDTHWVTVRLPAFEIL
jgi:hypothetical protein